MDKLLIMTKYFISYKNNGTIDISTKQGEEMLIQYIKQEYGVGKKQIKITEQSKIQLTNKFGETFAEIGEIKTY